MWTIKILNGLHQGAEATIRQGEYSIGRQDYCNLVLCDKGLQDGALHLQIRNEKLILVVDTEDAVLLNGRPVGPEAAHVDGVEIGHDDIVALGTVRMTFASTNPITEVDGRSSVDVPTDELDSSPAAAGNSLSSEEVQQSVQLDPPSARSAGWQPVALAATVIAVVAVFIGYLSLPVDASATMQAGATPPSNSVVAANHAAGASNGVSIPLSDEDRQSMMYRVREFIGDASLSTRFNAQGQLEITGVTKSTKTAGKVQEAKTEFKKMVDIVDAVSYPRNSGPETHAMPIKVKNVFIGPTSYFTSADGTKYFQGATFADGAEVIEISMERIVFLRDGRQIEYNLGKVGVQDAS